MHLIIMNYQLAANGELTQHSKKKVAKVIKKLRLFGIIFHNATGKKVAKLFIIVPISALVAESSISESGNYNLFIPHRRKD